MKRVLVTVVVGALCFLSLQAAGDQRSPAVRAAVQRILDLHDAQLAALKAASEGESATVAEQGLARINRAYEELKALVDAESKYGQNV